MSKGIRYFIESLKTQFKDAPFSGDFATWGEACAASSGYSSEIILEKVRNSFLKVKNGEAAFERDSMVYPEIEYSWPLLAAIMLVASCNGNRLNLIDFGGSMGSTYYQNRKFLSYLDQLNWNVVEQEHFVECGRQLNEDHNLKFYPNVEECCADNDPKAILFSSVIQYMESPYDLIEETIAREFDFILFDRTPFLTEGKDRLTIQKVPPEIYEATIPCWFLNVNTFTGKFGQHYDLVADFDGLERAAVKHSVFKGFIFKKRGKHAETL